MCPTILLAVTDQASRMSWESLLHHQGYLVIGLASEESLLASCMRVQPDLVLFIGLTIDIRGMEICRRLKADPRNKFIPILFAGNVGDVSCANGAPDDGIQQCPLSPAEVLIRVQSLLPMQLYAGEQAVSFLITLARCIEERNPYTKGQIEHVSCLAEQFGKNLNMNECDLETLNIAASLQDIGKVMIPDSILLKNGWLTLEERAVMELHPVEGERICSQVKSLRDVLPIIRHHHERIDGSGYPDGLHRNLIPYGARVLQTVNIYDALTTGCPYRKSVTAPKALTMLSEQADRGSLDKKLVNSFTSLIVSILRRSGSRIESEYRTDRWEMNVNVPR